MTIGKSIGRARSIEKDQPGQDLAFQKLSQNVRTLRKNKGYKLDDLAQQSGLSASTLSKIENRQISPTFDTLVALASGLDVDVGTLVSPVQAVGSKGRRAINRKGQGSLHETPVYDYNFLCTEISNKKLVPILTTIKAGDIEEFPALSEHEGEEFFYVLSGVVVLHTELYEPTELHVGDCAYFDSVMGHALVAGNKSNAQILWVSSTLDRAGEGEKLDADS